MTDKSKDTTQIQLGKLMCSIGLTYRTMGERLVMGTEMIHCITKVPPPAWVTAHKNLEIWSSLYNLQATQQVEECLLQMARLV